MLLYFTRICLSIGTPKNHKFSICPKWKVNGFYVSKGQIKLGTVTRFKYLGAVVSDDGSKPEIISRIAQATAALTKLKPIWRDNSISLGLKVKLMP